MVSSRVCAIPAGLAHRENDAHQRAPARAMRVKKHLPGRHRLSVRGLYLIPVTVIWTACAVAAAFPPSYCKEC